MSQLLQRFSLTGNQLKLIALLSMTIDHIGLHLLPQYRILRYLGRLAFPIYAYMIAEGCRYTKNKLRYLGIMVGFAFVCQLFYFFAMESLYQCILVTFSLSILVIYSLDYALNTRSTFSGLLVIIVLGFVCFITKILPMLLPETNFWVDYSLPGVLVPVIIYLGKTKTQALSMAAVALVFQALQSASSQWYALLALPLLALYNGRRGKLQLKYLFYIYYPIHLAVIYGIGLLI